MSKRNYVLPFDLSPKEIAVIPISPEVVSVMLNGEEKEVEAIELILEKWTQLNEVSPTEFGLHIQRRYGFSATEEKFRADEKARQRKITELSINIIKTIAAKENIEMVAAEEVLRQLQSGEGSITFASRYPEVMDRAFEIGELSSQLTYKTETVYVRRFIPGWPEELTEYLHREILEGLEIFLKEEFERTAGKHLKPSTKQIESLELSAST
jgi:hypothetical protein